MCACPIHVSSQIHKQKVKYSIITEHDEAVINRMVDISTHNTHPTKGFTNLYEPEKQGEETQWVCHLGRIGGALYSPQTLASWSVPLFLCMP